MPSTTQSDATPPPSSFRDPAGHLIGHDGRLLPPLLGYATIPAWLGSQSRARGAGLDEAKHMNPKKTRFVFAFRLRGYDVVRSATLPEGSRTMDLARRRA